MNREQFLLDVEDAFLNKGIKPKRNSYGGKFSGCCGVGAIRTVDNKEDVYPSIYAREKYNLSAQYISAFMCGFDNLRIGNVSEEARLGYNDGQEIWEKVKHLA